jgi:hypothetical protein
MVWIVVGLFMLNFVTRILRVLRRASLAVLGNGLIFRLWLVTRFVLSPALFLIAVGLIGSLPFKSAASEILLRALILLIFYGGAIVFATGVVADLATMIKTPRRGSPSDS